MKCNDNIVFLTVLLPVLQASEQQLGNLVRVVLLYGRSSALPVSTCAAADVALPLDLVFIHDKPEPRVNRVQVCAWGGSCFGVLQEAGRTEGTRRRGGGRKGRGGKSGRGGEEGERWWEERAVGSCVHA